MTLRLAILISGRGSNMMAIHQAIQDQKLDAEIKLILSNRTEAPGLDYARAVGIPTVTLEKKPGEDRKSYDKRLAKEIEDAQVDIIALAGFMRILSKKFVEHFQNRIVNIHPSLLPDFPGLEAQRQALEAGADFSGCTVHFVDEGCDTGPIIGQRKVPVLPGDDEESLSERILVEEHRLYSECLQLIAERKVRVQDGKVTINQ